jgi:hypothetical protein
MSEESLKYSTGIYKEKDSARVVVFAAVTGLDDWRSESESGLLSQLRCESHGPAKGFFEAWLSGKFYISGRASDVVHRVPCFF